MVSGRFVVPNSLAKGMCVGRHVAMKTKGQYAYNQRIQHTPLYQAS